MCVSLQSRIDTTYFLQTENSVRKIHLKGIYNFQKYLAMGLGSLSLYNSVEF